MVLIPSQKLVALKFIYYIFVLPVNTCRSTYTYNDEFSFTIQYIMLNKFITI